MSTDKRVILDESTLTLVRDVESRLGYLKGLTQGLLSVVPSEHSHVIEQYNLAQCEFDEVFKHVIADAISYNSASVVEGQAKKQVTGAYIPDSALISPLSMESIAKDLTELSEKSLTTFAKEPIVVDDELDLSDVTVPSNIVDAPEEPSIDDDVVELDKQVTPAVPIMLSPELNIEDIQNVAPVTEDDKTFDDLTDVVAVPKEVITEEDAERAKVEPFIPTQSYQSDYEGLPPRRGMATSKPVLVKSNADKYHQQHQQLKAQELPDDLLAGVLTLPTETPASAVLMNATVTPDGDTVNTTVGFGDMHTADVAYTTPAVSLDKVADIEAEMASGILPQDSESSALFSGANDFDVEQTAILQPQVSDSDVDAYMGDIDGMAMDEFPDDFPDDEFPDDGIDPDELRGI